MKTYVISSRVLNATVPQRLTLAGRWGWLVPVPVPIVRGVVVWPVMPWPVRRWRQLCIDFVACHTPDEQYLTRRVIDHEAAGPPEAPRTGMSLIAVARHDQ
jgi:hypothetical protein